MFPLPIAGPCLERFEPVMRSAGRGLEGWAVCSANARR